MMNVFWKRLCNRKTIGYTFFAVFTVTYTWNPASAVQFYTFTSPCNLVSVDTDAGTQSIVGNLGMSVEAMAFSKTKELYASVQPGFCGAHGSAGHLARINTSTAEVEVIGEFGFSDVDAMAFRPDGSLYAVSAGTDELFEVDIETGAGTLVGSVGFPFVGGIEFLSNDLLVGADMRSGRGGPGTFITIDQSTGVGTEIGPINFDSIEGMTFAPDGLLYGLSDTIGGGSGAIISIDPNTGTGTFVQDVLSPRFRDGLAAFKSFGDPTVPTEPTNTGVKSVPEPFSALSLFVLSCLGTVSVLKSKLIKESLPTQESTAA